jgi:hypothetical protein
MIFVATTTIAIQDNQRKKLPYYSCDASEGDTRMLRLECRPLHANQRSRIGELAALESPGCPDAVQSALPSMSDIFLRSRKNLHPYQQLECHLLSAFPYRTYRQRTTERVAAMQYRRVEEPVHLAIRQRINVCIDAVIILNSDSSRISNIKCHGWLRYPYPPPTY